MVETHPEKRLIGYARVSTYGQTLDSLQLEQLRAAGCSSHNTPAIENAPPQLRKLILILERYARYRSKSARLGADAKWLRPGSEIGRGLRAGLDFCRTHGAESGFPRVRRRGWSRRGDLFAPIAGAPATMPKGPKWVATMGRPRLAPDRWSRPCMLCGPNAATGRDANATPSGTQPGHRLPLISQRSDFAGVPYRIRTGVAAVRGGQNGRQRTVADGLCPRTC